MTKHIALVIMVKNESKRLPITLESCGEYIDSIIAYDTGSTDNTIKILRNFSDEKEIPLHLIEGVFENFSKNRNKLLNYADQFWDVDYLLLLDSNDTLQNGKNLRNELEDADGYYVNITLEAPAKPKISFPTIRIIKPRCGWKYEGVVHEYIKQEDDKPYPLLKTVGLYQERTQDNEKSAKRWPRDKELFLKEYNNNKSARTVFYLGQTCMWLGELEEAKKYFMERINWKEDEDPSSIQVYCSLYTLGLLEKVWQEKRRWFMNAWEYGHVTGYRIEPLLRMAEEYKRRKELHPMYMMLKMAVKLDLPVGGVNVNIEDYEYVRWKLLSSCCFYLGYVEEAISATQKAISARNKDGDKHVLTSLSYLQKIRDGMTEEEFSIQRREDFYGIIAEENVTPTLENEWQMYNRILNMNKVGNYESLKFE